MQILFFPIQLFTISCFSKNDLSLKSSYALIREELGTTYPSYTNGEKERLVCRPSRVDGVHDGFDPKIQSVKTADVWGAEKKWAGLYQSCAAHGDFKTRRSNV